MVFSGFFTGGLFWTCLKWLIIIAVWGVLTLGIFRKDSLPNPLQKSSLDNADITLLLRTLTKRNAQLWALVTLLVIAGIVSDIHRDIVAIHVAAASAQPELVSIAPTTATPQKSTALPHTSSPLPYMDITEFNEKDSKEQAYIDDLKRRYEAWLITYYYLKKCGNAEASDFDLIRNSLQKELATVNAESSAENNILLAAAGSYNEMYSSIPCDSGHLAASKATYDVNMQQLKKPSQPASGLKP